MIGKTILLISPESWGTNFVSKHHYANYLSKSNTVYFLNPARGYARVPFGPVSCKTSQIHKNLTIVDYVNLLPRLNHFPKAIQQKAYRRQARQIQKALGIQQFDVIWSFDPNRYFDQDAWVAEKTIYHTVDFHPHSLYEKDIILSSNHFFGVTPLILADHEPYRQGTLVTHAADLDGFKDTEKINLPGENKIRAIYTGNFHRHINYTLLQQLASNHRDVDFLLIGPLSPSNLAGKNTVELDTLKKLKQEPNLYFLGSVPAKELMSYLQLADINLVLFKKENERIHCSPHKLMGYFYTGNVTLSNYIDAHKNTDKDIIFMSASNESTLADFARIKTNLDHYNRPEVRTKRRQFAEENSYQHKIDFISQQVYPGVNA